MSMLYTIEQESLLPGFRTGLSVLKGTYRLGTASFTGARFTKWIDALLDTECRLGDTSLPTGIMILPYLDGVRSPFDNPDATPVFMGMRPETTRNDLAVAAREALGFEITMIMNMIEKEHTLPDELNCTGGLTNIPELMQLTADITGKRQRVFHSVDTSYGDVMIAMLGADPDIRLESLDGVGKSWQPDEIYEPNPELHGQYSKLSARYDRLYGSLRELF